MGFARRLGLFWLSLLGLAVCLVVVSLDWRGAEDRSAPVVVSSFRAEGPLLAGAAKVSLVPDFPAPMAGFATRGDEPFSGVSETVQARALVLEAGGKRLGLVSVELLLVAAPLRAKVIDAVRDLGLDDVVIAATHTHSSVGGFWDSSLAGFLGVGGYDARVETFLVDRIAAALKEARANEVPARLSSATMTASQFGLNRHMEQAPVDNLLTGVRISSANDDRILARLVVLGVHPTIVDRDTLMLSPDWPGAMSSALEVDGGVALFWQGAGGDATWGKRQGNMTRDQRVVLFGGAVASDVRGVMAAAGEGEPVTTLSHARVRLPLPLADAAGSIPSPMTGLATNVLQRLAHPGTTEVSFTRLGNLSIAAVPAEPVAALGMEWRKALGATVVGLADAYVGYVETPEKWRAKEGEAVRSYFGAELGPRLFDALTIARDAAR